MLIDVFAALKIRGSQTRFIWREMNGIGKIRDNGMNFLGFVVAYDEHRSVIKYWWK